MFRHTLALAVCFGAFLSAAERDADSPGRAHVLAASLRQISLDPNHTYRIRDLSLARGDIKLYLNEGVLAFYTPIADHLFAALFTTEGSEAGDAEIIVMPPQRSERASLASFAQAPNLDEHFSNAIFLFTDETAAELLEQIHRSPSREIPDLGSLAERANPVAREIAGQLDIPLVEALLDRHAAADGIFYSVIVGKRLGQFDVTYDPEQAESVFVGRVNNAVEKKFELWTNFRPRRSPPFVQPEVRVRSYRIDAEIRPDLSMSVSAVFSLKTSAEDGSVIPLRLSPHLTVGSAKIDGAPAEVLQHPSQRLSEFGSAETLLLIAGHALEPAVEHTIEIEYAGKVIRKTGTGEYFVDDRNTWYPVYGPISANFDLRFHCPDRLHLVSTGEPVNESVENGVRSVHRKTIAPAALAGFNLGEYAVRQQEHKSYSIEIDSPDTAAASLTADPALPRETADILDHYTEQWKPLPIHSIAVSPIAGYFGQGFPGLIYLSSVSFIKEEKRSVALRGARLDAFFSELLLPHEIAHQWWGNIVRQADYRSGWIPEAMANLSALEYIERTKGVAARNNILESYRRDLTAEQANRKTVESAGPVDFGDRLIDTHGLNTWLVILYEKGSWILHMLRERLGEEDFRRMQIRLLEEYSAKPLSNDEFRQVASSFVPAGQPDKQLTNFFETWVYSTGIPGMALRGSNGRTVTVELSGVEDDFVTEVPLRCKGASTFWVRAGAGSNTVELPRGVSACELPSPRDFLFTPPRFTASRQN